MRFIMAFIAVLIIYLVYGFMVSTYDVNKRTLSMDQNHPYPFYDYRGVTNVSSIRTIGSGEDKEIISDAKQADLDYVIITDYNLIDDNSSPESYYGDLLVLRGAKYSYLDSRLLYYRTDGMPEGKTLGEIQVHLTDILSQPPDSRLESSVVLAHPFLKGYSWSGEWPVGLDGIEIINFKRVQQQHLEESKPSFIWSLLIYPFNPELAFLRLFKEPESEIQLWNTLNQKRAVIGHLGLEATARAIPFTGSVIKFPSYETLFRLGSEHVLLRSELTGSMKSDKIKILRALRRGEFYLALDVLGNPKGFNVLLEDKDQLYLMGSKIKYKNKLKFRIEVPPIKNPAVVVVYRNGEEINELPGSTTEFAIDKPGVYRFVVRLKIELPLPDRTRWIPWLYTNHFYIE